MLGWFHALLPREERFFDMFERHSHFICAGAKALRAMLEGGEAVEAHCRIVMQREREADEVTREVLIAVRRTFITPFDRIDIKDLITAMDNAIDQMQAAAKAIILFEVRSFTPQMRQMGDSIVEARRRVPRPVMGGADLSGGDGAWNLRGRLAHRAHHGYADHPTRPAAPRRCFWRPTSAFRSRPRIPSPAPSSASARRATSVPCAGRSPAGSSWRGS